MPKTEKPKFVQKICKHHGSTEYVLEGRGSYRCKRCRSERVTIKRRNLRKQLVTIFGSKCINPDCNYSKYAGNLTFHHLDPSKKKFAISGKGLTRSFDKLYAEAKKCILICHNCHGEVHANILKADKLEKLQIEIIYSYEKTLDNLVTSKVEIICLKCGVSVSKGAKHCKKCSPRKTKIKWPSIDELDNQINKTSKSEVARKLGVSEAAVRKHLKCA